MQLGGSLTLSANSLTWNKVLNCMGKAVEMLICYLTLILHMLQCSDRHKGMGNTFTSGYIKCVCFEEVEVILTFCD